MSQTSESRSSITLAHLPLAQACKLIEIRDEQLRQQLLHLGIGSGCRIERLSMGYGLQPLILSFDGLTLALLPEAAESIRVEA